MNQLWEIYSQGGSDMYKLRRKLYSQNFLHSRRLVKSLVRSSSIGETDLVLEVGPGKGIITEELVDIAKEVIGIEIDSHWYNFLKTKFERANNLTFYNSDFLTFPLPKAPYKVFANVPFSIEGVIVRKLIDSDNPPEDCYLIIMRELADRLVALRGENQFSVMHKPWFDFSIYHSFNRTDFTPFSNVDSSMMRFEKKKNPLLPWSEKNNYHLFIKYCFRQGLPPYQSLRNRYGSIRAIEVLNKIGVGKKARLTDLTLKQWIKLYSTFDEKS